MPNFGSEDVKVKRHRGKWHFKWNDLNAPVMNQKRSKPVSKDLANRLEKEWQRTSEEDWDQYNPHPR